MQNGNRFENGVLFVAFAALMGNVVTAFATNTVDTAVFDRLESDALVYVGYGVAAFIAILGAGMAIVAGRWVYSKIKSGIRSA